MRILLGILHHWQWSLASADFAEFKEREDKKQAAMAGLMTKQLTQASVEQHLAKFGIDPESGSHTQLAQLSGGMKVKVVHVAAMGQNPHI